MMPSPGSDEAVDAGCTCRVAVWYRVLVGDPVTTVIDCPVHGVCANAGDDEEVVVHSTDGAA
jgi:hypothetical protein